MAFTAGQKVRASELNRIGTLVGRNQRTTNTAAYTTITRILSVRAPVKAGRTYRVCCQIEEFGNLGSGTGQSELRYTTNDTEPTTTSTLLGRALVHHASTGSVPDTVSIMAHFNASADGFLRVVLCAQRVIGSVTLAMSADASFPGFLTVEDVGDTVATTGTVY